MLSATDAPMPTDEPPTPPPAGCAFELDAAFDAAVSETSPPVSRPVEATFAVVERFTIVSANDPATPTVPPEAPDVASDEKVSTSSLATGATEASTEIVVPKAVPAIDASFVTVASVIATPAAIAAGPALAAVPLPLLDASAFSALLTVSAPPAFTIAPARMVAFAETFAIVIATAAATLIPPPDVEADGVAVEPEP